MTEGFVGSRLHVTLCLAWFPCVFAAWEYFDPRTPMFIRLAISIPTGGASLALTHLVFFAFRYVLTGKKSEFIP
jgi:hypothetical protein